MSLFKNAMLAAGLALGLTTMAYTTTTAVYAQAQNTPGDMLSDIGEDEAIYYNAATGKMTKARAKMTNERHTKAMAAGAKEVAKGTKPTKTSLVYRHGGKIYMLENKPGSTAGKTMLQESFQDMFGGDHQY